MRCGSLLLACVLGIVAGMPAFGLQPARGPLPVRNTTDLSSDRKVQEVYPDFVLAARSNVVYKYCQDTFVFTPEQLAFQKEAYDSIADRYSRAFYEAYISRVGYPPNKIVIDNYTKYIYKQEAEAMQQMADLISKRNCDQGKVIRTMRYMEKLRYAQLAAQGKLPADNAAQTATPATTTTPPTATTPGSK